MKHISMPCLPPPPPHTHQPVEYPISIILTVLSACPITVPKMTKAEKSVNLTRSISQYLRQMQNHTVAGIYHLLFVRSSYLLALPISGIEYSLISCFLRQNIKFSYVLQEKKKVVVFIIIERTKSKKSTLLLKSEW